MIKTTETVTKGWGRSARTVEQTTVVGTITAVEAIESGYATGTYAVTIDGEQTYRVTDISGIVAARVGIEITGVEGREVDGMTALTIKTDLALTY